MDEIIEEGNTVLYREWVDIHKPPVWDTLVGLVIQKIFYKEDLESNITKELYIVLIEGKLKQCYPCEIELLKTDKRL